jgi:hypothetical protein
MEEYKTHDYNALFADYYNAASIYKPEFSQWASTNYSVYSSETVSGYMVMSNAASKKYRVKDDMEVPSEEHERKKLQNHSELMIFSSRKVDDIYDMYSIAGASKSADGFARYTISELKLPQEPSQIKIFGKEFGRQKTPQEKAAEEKAKREKEDAKKKIKEQENIADIERKSKLEREKLELDALERNKKRDLNTQKDIEKIQNKKEKVSIVHLEKQIEGKEIRLQERDVNSKRKDELEKKLDETRKKEASPSSALFSGLFKGKEPELLEWSDEDAYSVFQALTRPESVRAKQAQKINYMLQHITSKNYFIRTLMESAKTGLNLVDRDMVCKMLALVRASPNKFKSGGVTADSTQYTGTETWDDVGQYTVSDYYEVMLAHQALCQGETMRSIEKMKIRESAPSMKEKIKEKVGIKSGVLQWGDELAEAVRLKLTEKNPQIGLDVAATLNRFVKEICKNSAVLDAVKAAKSFVSSSGPPISDIGVALLFSVWRFHPTKDSKKKDVDTSKYVDSQNPKVLILDKTRADKPTPRELAAAYHVYQRLAAMSKKNPVLQMDSFSPSSERYSNGSKYQFNGQSVDNFCNTVETIVKGRVRPASERSNQVGDFIQKLTLQNYISLMGMNSVTFTEAHRSTFTDIKIIIQAYYKLLTSLSISE